MLISQSKWFQLLVKNIKVHYQRELLMMYLLGLALAVHIPRNQLAVKQQARLRRHPQEYSGQLMSKKASTFSFGCAGRCVVLMGTTEN